MTPVVADASVIVKWLFPEREGERDTAAALALFDRVRGHEIELHEPPHWLAEVAGVVTRLSPETAEADVHDLCDLDVAVHGSRDLYAVACRLSIELEHHLFDTLYHALALEVDGAVLVTADERYYRKARSRGRIVLLADFAAARGSGAGR